MTGACSLATPKGLAPRPPFIWCWDVLLWALMLVDQGARGCRRAAELMAGVAGAATPANTYACIGCKTVCCAPRIRQPLCIGTV